MSANNSDLILDLLEQEIFSGKVACGKNLDYTQLVKKRQKASTHIPNLDALIPDNVYTPQIMLAVDFSHTFVQDMEFVKTDNSKTVIQGKRIVDQSTIMSTAKSLLYYYKYYYEYIVTYCQDANNMIPEQSAVDNQDTSLAGEAQAVEFINKIINYFLTSVNVNRVRNQISTCTLTFRDNPQYGAAGKATRLFYDVGMPLLGQLFAPMLPFTVWARGRIYSDFMFPIFTGYITRVTYANDQGYTTLRLDGKDCLELARISLENLNPATIQQAEAQLNSLNFFNKPFYGIDHIQIVRSIFFGGSIVWDGTGNRIMTNEELNSNEVSDGPKIYPIGNFLPADEESSIATPADILNNTAIPIENFSLNNILNRLGTNDPTNPSAHRYLCTWGYNLTPYRPFGVGSRDTYTSVFSSRLDVLQNVAATVYYEFYTDGAGNVHYHPMRLANDFLFYDSFYPKDVSITMGDSDTTLRGVVVNPHRFPFSQVVSNEELTSINKTKNIEELKTYCVFRGTPPVDAVQQPDSANLIGYYRDDINLAKFGYRREDRNSTMVNENHGILDSKGSYQSSLNAMAKVLMDYANGELYTMTASMLFRPELELCAPLYLVEDSEIFYVQSISHTIEIGSTATTVVNASFGRHELEPEVDILSYMLHTEMLAKLRGAEIKYVGSVEELNKNINFTIPLTAHTEHLNKQYEKLQEYLFTPESME
jgi:hypothetical protein